MKNMSENFQENTENSARARVLAAIDAFKRGEMLIVMDDEHRENEGDLVLAGIFTTPAKINFMAQHARGLICVAISEEIAKNLELPPMVSQNLSNHNTAFTVSIDAKNAKTGISAFERNMTIELMCRENASADDFVRPGHIFPLVAKNGGVLVRTGHTEAGVDLCLLAGLKPISVICEIMKDDGSMMQRGDKFLSDFARKHGLLVVYTSDLVAFRIENENLLSELSRDVTEFLHEKCTKFAFHDHLKRTHFALFFTGLGSSAPDFLPIVKFQLIKENFEFLSDTRKYDFFMLALQKISQNGGVIVFLHDENSEQKGGGVEQILKNIGIGAQILKHVGVQDFTLLSNSNKIYNALSGFGMKISSTISFAELNAL